MGFIDQGTVNSSLRYSPPEPTNAIKTGKLYKLSRVTTRMPIYGSDGKSVIEIKPGPIEWQIEGNQGQRWTTVNTAIRYIIEMRNKTTDPTVRKNADETIAKLLKLH
jgi:hypothetical protein